MTGIGDRSRRHCEDLWQAPTVPRCHYTELPDGFGRARQLIEIQKMKIVYCYMVYVFCEASLLSNVAGNSKGFLPGPVPVNDKPTLTAFSKASFDL